MNAPLLVRLLVAALIALAPLSVGAQPSENDAAVILDDFASTAARIEGVLETGSPTEASLETLRTDLADARETLAPVRAAAEARLAPLRAQLAPLGAAPAEGEPPEPADVAARRADLNAQIAVQEALVKQTAQAEARVAAIAERIATERRALFTAALMRRGPTPLSSEVIAGTLRGLAELGQGIVREVSDRVRVSGLVGRLADRLGLPALLALAGLVIVVGLRRWTERRLIRLGSSATAESHRVGLAILLTLTRLLMPAVALGLILFGIANSDLLGPRGEALLEGLALTTACLIGAYALGGAYFAPNAPALRLARLDDAAARIAHRWLIALAALVGLDRALVVRANDLGLPVEAEIGLNAGLLVLSAIAMWGFLRAARFSPAAPEPQQIAVEDGDEAEPAQGLIGRGIFLLLRLTAAISPLLALAGYFAASRYVFYPAIFSAAVIGVCVLLYIAVSALVDGVAAPRASEGETSEPERLRLIPVIVAFFLGSAALPVLALIWGADTTDLATAWRQAVDGFTVGDVTISPFDFFAFVLVFSIGYMVTRLAQGLLRRSVLPLTRLDAGGRSAILAGVGYLGVILSALAAISSTEIDLTNLAIVAGALSVGIGFGLQNIVNNFVSGIILLIERPIKTGDWVEIAGVHGTVKQVNVRSTEIQTFDRASMFVPNADLISGTVTNWTHGNLHGRLIVPVGVAYGTDARKVEKVLLEIAQGHPMLLSRPAPFVIFKGFGADSIDFEIRGVLSDVNWILHAGSDIRFSIYERFAEEGIEIPFAQRDLHIKNPEALVALARRQAEDGDDA